MILTDDNFAAVAGAVRARRTIYDNIVKSVRFQVRTNVAAILTMIVGSRAFLTHASTLTPLMLLWVNVIARGPPALALRLEPSRRTVMRKPPRASSARDDWPGSCSTGTIYTVHFGLGRSVATVQSLAFTTFVLYQLFNILNVGPKRASTFGPLLIHNSRLWAAPGSVLALQVCAIYLPPAQALFGTTDLTTTDFVTAAGIASSMLWREEARKLVLHHITRPQTRDAERRQK